MYVYSVDVNVIAFCNHFCHSVLSDDDMISIGSMLSLGDSYYLDDNDDDMEVVPSPRLRHKRNLAQGHRKVSGITCKFFCDHRLERRSLATGWLLCPGTSN